MAYPLAFERDITGPKRVTFQNKNLVLWKGKKGVVAQPDSCPHRAAKLSDGRVIDNRLECPYHGWRFNETGKCTKIPQLLPGKKKPGACNLKNTEICSYDGIVWSGDKVPTVPAFEKEYNTYFITDKSYYLPFSYQLQIENLLDPAHLHFVHDGFQGNRSRACPIKLVRFHENEKEIYGYFAHLDDVTPDISMLFTKPGVVDVSVINKDTKELFRKNVIYVSPGDEGNCNVLFRDIAIDNLLGFYEKTIFARGVVENNYKTVNKTVIDLITEQDVKAIKGQMENRAALARYTMPAECDRMIVAFRLWLLKARTSLTKVI